MSTLARLFNFQPHEPILSNQFNLEFNQIVNLLNGTTIDKNVVLSFDDPSTPTLDLIQLGAGPIATFSGPGGVVASIDVDGAAAFDGAVAAGGGLSGASLLLESANPTIELRDNAGGTQPDYQWSLNAGVLNAAYLVSGNCNQAHDNATNTSRFDAIIDLTNRVKVNMNGVAIGANNRLSVNHATAPNTDVATSLRGAAAIRPLDVVNPNNTNGDLARFFDDADITNARPSKVAISALGLITSRAVLATTETSDLIAHDGTLKTNVAQAGNVGTSETDLFSYTCPARLLANVGDSIEFEIGAYYATGNSKTICVYFGGTAFLVNTTTDADRHVYIRGTIMRIDDDSVRVMAMLAYSQPTAGSGALAGSTTITNVDSLTFTNTQVFKITGEGGATNDVIYTTTKLRFCPNRQ